MAPEKNQDSDPTPLRAIRRFDVFAEYSRQERLEKGYPEDAAKGYGVWLAKVVAARRFGAGAPGTDRKKKSARQEEPEEEPEFRSVGDELQTDETFDHDIINRMGSQFYDVVFVPAIEEAREKGEAYETIRDEIRKDWKPAKSKSK